jgi:2,3-bisphosphoglycerate-independent phosphoglycerate mutase
MDSKILLLILDGWGLASDPRYSAIAQAQTPFIDRLYEQYPHSQLEASGPAVGLPVGQMGNSEVGHQHLGAGRVIEQDLVRISRSIATGQLTTNPVWCQAIAYAKAQQKPIHLMGLVSDGGVHAHIDHLKGLCKLLQASEVPSVFIHAFTDGRDAGIQQARYFIDQLIPFTATGHITLASIIGRYYAMDRDAHWERTKVAYDALVQGRGVQVPTAAWSDAIAHSYTSGITDEFIQPIILTDSLGKVASIRPEDVVLCFNFRTDRSRQLTQALTQTGLSGIGMQALPLHYITLTSYDERFHNVQVLFPKEVLPYTLGEVLSQYGKRQLRIAESEKYPHVTYFFSGGREAPFPGEERIVIPSPAVPTYDKAPSMSAPALTARILPVLAQRQFDFICLNIANPDMVGHTGVWQATIEACQVVDRCVSDIITTALSNGYTTLLVSDHGNAEVMYYPDGQVHTAHTLNPVPFIPIAPYPIQRVRPGTLADVAPTILKAMNLPIPTAMEATPLYG